MKRQVMHLNERLDHHSSVYLNVCKNSSARPERAQEVVDQYVVAKHTTSADRAAQQQRSARRPRATATMASCIARKRVHKGPRRSLLPQPNRRDVCSVFSRNSPCPPVDVLHFRPETVRRPSPIGLHHEAHLAHEHTGRVNPVKTQIHTHNRTMRLKRAERASEAHKKP